MEKHIRICLFVIYKARKRMNGTPVFARVQYDRKMMTDEKLSRVIENFRATLGEFPSEISGEFALYDGKKWVDGKKPETWQHTFALSQRFGYLEIKRPETSEEEKQGLRYSCWLVQEGQMLYDEDGNFYDMFIKDEFKGAVFADIHMIPNKFTYSKKKEKKEEPMRRQTLND